MFKYISQWTKQNESIYYLYRWALWLPHPENSFQFPWHAPCTHRFTWLHVAKTLIKTSRNGHWRNFKLQLQLAWSRLVTVAQLQRVLQQMGNVRRRQFIVKSILITSFLTNMFLQLWCWSQKSPVLILSVNPSIKILLQLCYRFSKFWGLWRIWLLVRYTDLIGVLINWLSLKLKASRSFCGGGDRGGGGSGSGGGGGGEKALVLSYYFRPKTLPRRWRLDSRLVVLLYSP